MDITENSDMRLGTSKVGPDSEPLILFRCKLNQLFYCTEAIILELVHFVEYKATISFQEESPVV